ATCGASATARSNCHATCALAGCAAPTPPSSGASNARSGAPGSPGRRPGPAVGPPGSTAPARAGGGGFRPRAGGRTGLAAAAPQANNGPERIDTPAPRNQNTRLVLRRGTQAANGSRL